MAPPPLFLFGLAVMVLGWSLLMFGASSGETVMGQEVVNLHMLWIAQNLIVSGGFFFVAGIVQRALTARSPVSIASALPPVDQTAGVSAINEPANKAVSVLNTASDSSSVGTLSSADLDRRMKALGQRLADRKSAT